MEIITERILFNYQNICADAVQHSHEVFVQLRKKFLYKGDWFLVKFHSKTLVIKHLLHPVFKANLKLCTLRNTGWIEGCVLSTNQMFAFRYNQEQSWEMEFKNLWE